MIIDRKFILDGTQSYNVKEGDIVIVSVKGNKDFQYKIPDNFSGSISITIKGTLTEIVSTPTDKDII